MSGSLPSLGVALFPHYPPDEFVALARVVDSDEAFSHLWIPDERFFRDLAVEMTLAATSTERVMIGSAVTDPYIRHPALTAVAMASIDEVSHGRLIAGIGAGISGFDALGIAREKPQQTIRESVQLMRALWKGDPVQMEGSRVRFDGRIDFTPFRPDIPVWIAGRGPAVLRLGGEVADGVFIGGLASRPGLDYAHANIDEGLARAGRQPDAVTRGLWLHTAVAEDGEAARAAVRNIVVGVLISSRSIIGELGLPIPAELLSALEGVAYGVNNPEMQRAAAMVDDDTLSHFSVAGTPAEVGERMRELAEMGVQHVAVVPWLTAGQDLREFLTGLADGVRHAASIGGTHG